MLSYVKGLCIVSFYFPTGLFGLKPFTRTDICDNVDKLSGNTRRG
jgi:hypothetical protein